MITIHQVTIFLGGKANDENNGNERKNEKNSQKLKDLSQSRLIKYI